MRGNFLKTIFSFFAVCASACVFSSCVILSVSPSDSSGVNSSSESSHEHSYSQEVVAPTCTEQGYTLHTCSCGKFYIDNYKSALNHDFAYYVPNGDATYEADGTKTAVCERNGCGERDTVIDVGSKKKKELSFKTLVVSGLDVSGVLPSDAESFDFGEEIQMTTGVSFVLAKDEAGEELYDESVVPLMAGENVVYVLEKIDGEITKTYRVELYRRCVFTVILQTEDGVERDRQTVEENGLASAPTRAGYTLVCDFDFSQPITENLTITIAWTANTDTAYRVEHYLQNLDDEEYSLEETEHFTGTTEEAATAESKAFAHFTYNQAVSVPSGVIQADGSLVLKLYYTRNTYSVTVENSEFGTVDKVGTFAYGTALTATATPLLGYDTLWYHGETLLLKGETYRFTVEKDVCVKFVLNAEMAKFEFTCSTSECIITGVKDRSLEKAILPDCVTKIAENAFENCIALRFIIIPKSVVYIGANAFKNCGILNIYCEAKQQPVGWDAAWNVLDRFVLWDCYNNGVEHDGHIYTGWH